MVIIMKKHPNVHLSRFLYGICHYYQDKGMSPTTAKERMFKDTFHVLRSFYTDKDELADRLLFRAIDFLRDLVNARGVHLSNELRSEKDQDRINELRRKLTHLKNLRDSLERFKLS